MRIYTYVLFTQQQFYVFYKISQNVQMDIYLKFPNYVKFFLHAIWDVIVYAISHVNILYNYIYRNRIIKRKTYVYFNSCDHIT